MGSTMEEVHLEVVGTVKATLVMAVLRKSNTEEVKVVKSSPL